MTPLILFCQIVRCKLSFSRRVIQNSPESYRRAPLHRPKLTELQIACGNSLLTSTEKSGSLVMVNEYYRKTLYESVAELDFSTVDALSSNILNMFVECEMLTLRIVPSRSSKVTLKAPENGKIRQ